jgi:hypothetical protein
MAEALPVERLRAYLQDLKPEARVMLLAELERSAARGDDVPGGDVLIEELRRAVRASAPASSPVAPRVSNPARLFFAPLDPFLIDHDEAPMAGRIARTALDPLWQWICRDLVPADAKAYGEELERSLADEKTMTRLVRAFQDLVVNHIQEALAAAGHNDRARRRLAGQVGTPRALDDLGAVLGVLKARDALALIASRLPLHIRNLGDEQLENVKTLLDSPIARHPDIFIYALVVVMKRLTTPCQLVRLAVKAAESDKAQRIKDSPYAAAVAIVLGEIAHAVAEFRRVLRRGEVAAAGVVLKGIHDAVRTLRTEMDLSGDSPWARELAALRGAVSALVQAEIEAVPGRLRRLLRPHAAKEVPGIDLDPADVAETEALIEFLNTCRNYASELAINEVTLRVHSEIENFLDTGTPLLLESLRAAGPSDRAFRMSQVDAAVRFAGKVFGPSYATLLAKAAEVAQHGERKAAKG